MLMKDGQPWTFYHGTNVAFDAFRPLSHFGDALIAEAMSGDVGDCVKSEMLCSNGIDFSTTSNLKLSIPVQLKIDNPVLFPGGGASLDRFQDYFFQIMLARQLGINSLADYIRPYRSNDYTVSQKFKDACAQIDFLPELRFIFDDPMNCPYDQVKKELALENLYPVLDDSPYAEQRNRYHLAAHRMIRAYESLGYDGALYRSFTEHERYAYPVIFRPEQVMRLDKDVTFPEHEFAAQKDVALDTIKAEWMKKGDVKPLTPEEVKNYYVSIIHKDTSPKKRLVAEQFYWTDFALRKVMPEIAKITNQSKFGWHGLEHTEQVILYGLHYALAENVRPLPVILACALHDCARTDDEYNEVHGPNCAPIAYRFLAAHRFDLSDKEIDQVVDAVVNHTTGRNAPNGISACLWDADRTRLSWAWGFNEKFYSTETAKKVASLNEVGQREYLQKQQAYLFAHPEWNSVLVEAQLRKSKERELSFLKLKRNGAEY